MREMHKEECTLLEKDESETIIIQEEIDLGDESRKIAENSYKKSNNCSQLLFFVSHVLVSLIYFFLQSIKSFIYFFYKLFSFSSFILADFLPHIMGMYFYLLKLHLSTKLTKSS
jgi:hypothetical protein